MLFLSAWLFLFFPEKEKMIASENRYTSTNFYNFPTWQIVERNKKHYLKCITTSFIIHVSRSISWFLTYFGLQILYKVVIILQLVKNMYKHLVLSCFEVYLQYQILRVAIIIPNPSSVTGTLSIVNRYDGCNSFRILNWCFNSYYVLLCNPMFIVQSFLYMYFLSHLLQQVAGFTY